MIDAAFVTVNVPHFVTMAVVVTVMMDGNLMFPANAMKLAYITSHASAYIIATNAR